MSYESLTVCCTQGNKLLDYDITDSDVNIIGIGTSKHMPHTLHYTIKCNTIAHSRPLLHSPHHVFHVINATLNKFIAG